MIPDGTLFYADDAHQILNVSLYSLAAGKQVMLAGVHSAFTPRGSLKHVPGFIEKAEELKSKGISEIFVLRENNSFREDYGERDLPGFNRKAKLSSSKVTIRITPPQLVSPNSKYIVVRVC